MKRVYISHPYASDPEVNKARVDQICKSVLEEEDVLPISPVHLFGFATDDYRAPILHACLDLLDMVDEVWVYGDSPGCRLETKTALRRGIPVRRK